MGTVNVSAISRLTNVFSRLFGVRASNAIESATNAAVAGKALTAADLNNIEKVANNLPGAAARNAGVNLKDFIPNVKNQRNPTEFNNTLDDLSQNITPALRSQIKQKGLDLETAERLVIQAGNNKTNQQKLFEFFDDLGLNSTGSPAVSAPKRLAWIKSNLKKITAGALIGGGTAGLLLAFDLHQFINSFVDKDNSSDNNDNKSDNNNDSKSGDTSATAIIVIIVIVALVAIGGGIALLLFM